MSDDNGWRGAAEIFTSALASTDPTPGGGSAAGVAGAMGCALGRMAAGISAAKKKIEEDRRSGLRRARAEFEHFQERMMKLTSEDAAAFEEVMEAYKIPRDSSERAGRLEASLKKAAEVPLDTARTALKALVLVRENKELTVGTVGSDMNCAAHLLRSAGLCALENVEINLGLMKDEGTRNKLAAEAEALRGGLTD